MAGRGGLHPRRSPSKLTWKGTSERVIAPCGAEAPRAATVFGESGCLGVQPKVGGKLHLKLNTGTRPIANKYREGKVQSTLKRGLNVPEIAVMQAYETCSVFGRLEAPE